MSLEADKGYPLGVGMNASSDLLSQRELLPSLYLSLSSGLTLSLCDLCDHIRKRVTSIMTTVLMFYSPVVNNLCSPPPLSPSPLQGLIHIHSSHRHHHSPKCQPPFDLTQCQNNIRTVQPHHLHTFICD